MPRIGCAVLLEIAATSISYERPSTRCGHQTRVLCAPISPRECQNLHSRPALKAGARCKNLTISRKTAQPCRLPVAPARSWSRLNLTAHGIGRQEPSPCTLQKGPAGGILNRDNEA